MTMDDEELDAFLLRMQLRADTFARGDPDMPSLVVVQRIDIKRLVAVIRHLSPAPSPATKRGSGAKRGVPDGSIPEGVVIASGTVGEDPGLPMAGQVFVKEFDKPITIENGQVLLTRMAVTLPIPDPERASEEEITAVIEKAGAYLHPSDVAKKEGISLAVVYYHIKAGNIKGVESIPNGAHMNYFIPADYVISRKRRGRKKAGVQTLHDALKPIE